MLGVGLLTETLMWLHRAELGAGARISVTHGSELGFSVGGHWSSGCSCGYRSVLVTAGGVGYEEGRLIGGMSPESEVGQ